MPSSVMSWNHAEKMLTSAWPSFTPRVQQREMALAVASTVRKESPHPVLFAQAGCGCGKSLAYLVPAIAHGGRVVVSVTTKALQDQLTHTDLPKLRQTLFPELTFAALKGRSSYVCRRAADQNGYSGFIGAGGERADVTQPVDDATWSKMTVDAEGCVGRSCPFVETCFSEIAKNKAQSARVVVVNTSLLTQDLRLRAASDHKKSLLGDFSLLVVDEAHEFPAIVASGLSTRVTLRRVLDAVSRVAYHFKSPETQRSVQTLGSVASEWFGDVATWFSSQQETSADLDNDDRLGLVSIVAALAPLCRAAGALECVCEPDADDENQVCEFKRRLDALASDFRRFSSPTESDVEWLEYDASSRAVALCRSPVEVGGFLHDAVWSQKKPTVLTSATLAVDGDFGYMSRRVGVSSYREVNVGTPFDYGKQSLLFVPESGSPSPKDGVRYREWMFPLLQRLIDASGGGALVLFTSTAAMRSAFEVMSKRLSVSVWCQGQRPHRELIDRFSSSRDSVLFGTRSFMTGVDVPGDACRLVVIDKMPFPSPSDPLFKARSAAVEKKFGQGSSFRRVAIPDMSLTLAQAFGRLIRSVDDRGVVALLDVRFRAGWASSIRRSLPASPLTGSVADVADFYKGV